jgi:hypothetical protein
LGQWGELKVGLIPAVEQLLPFIFHLHKTLPSFHLALQRQVKQSPSTHAYNIGTIDMSARTTNTMTLATGTTIPSIYGNWTNGTGVTLSGTGTLTFAGRGSQTVTSAGRTFTQSFYHRHTRRLGHASGCF